MTTLQRIRHETGQKPSEAIRWYAENGYSMTYTAISLEISRQTLQRFVQRFELKKFFRDQRDMVPDSKQGNRGKGGWRHGQGRIGYRSPLIHKGIVYRPGEPMHHYLFATLSKYELRKKYINLDKVA